MAGDLGITLLSVEDPHLTDVVNGWCSEEYKRGLERLVAVEVVIRNASRTETRAVRGNFHVFDDAHYTRQSLGLDSRSKEPRIVEGYLAPGGLVRGWVTFCLPWERQAARVQFFTDYLSAKIAVFDLPLLDEGALARLRADVAERGARATASKALEEQRREVKGLEVRAKAAQALLEYEEKVRDLEVRAERARETIARAAEMMGRLEALPRAIAETERLDRGDDDE
jgi:hypothetical protein